MAEKQVLVSDELIDEIVDEVLDSMPEKQKIFKPIQQPTQSKQKKSEESIVFEKGIFSELENIKRRVNDFEGRLQKVLNEVRTSTIETERELNEKVEDATKDNEKQVLNLEEQVMHLEGEIDFLRTSIIKLSNELKNRKIIS